MKVLVLAAGYGTRLYPIIKDTAKPLLAVAGKPLINHLLDKIRNCADLKKVIVVTNNKFNQDFISWKEQNQDFPVPLNIINDGTMTPDDRLGAVGDIHFVCEQAAIEDDLLVLGGDNLFDYSLDDYIHFAQAKAPGVTIGLYDIQDLKQATKFGVVEIDDQGKVVDFQEKPEHPRSTLIAMCSYYIPRDSIPRIFDYVQQSKKTDKAGDYIRWLSQTHTVYGFTFEGKWYDIGSIENYKEAQDEFKN